MSDLVIHLYRVKPFGWAFHYQTEPPEPKAGELRDFTMGESQQHWRPTLGWARWSAKRRLERLEKPLHPQPVEILRSSISEDNV